MAKNNQSALLAKYYNMYKKNPNSRVFAPLAESFRKLGMLDDAYKILKEGIRNHPTYTLGYIVLAHCYYDQQKYELTYNTLRPIIAQNADNISLQKIFAQACIHLGHLEEALDTFKYLLFMNPREKFFAEQVKRLEDDLMVGHKKLSLDQLIKAPDLPAPIIPAIEAVDDDWVRVNFGQKSQELPQSAPAQSTDPDNEWVMNRLDDFKPHSIQEHPILKTESIIESNLDDDFYADEFEEEGDIETANNEALSSDAPIISHTLIDLYCAQHYYDKAIELLEKIIELNPKDQASIQKLQKVKLLQHSDSQSMDSTHTEQEGHDELIQIIETQVKTKSPKELRIQNSFNSFLNALKDKSQHYR